VDVVANRIDGARIAYRNFAPSGSIDPGANGTGAPIVMVHGSALSQVIWRGFGYVRALGADHQIITLDLRGHGRSDKPHEASAYAMELFVADVLAVLDELGVDRAHYLGYSLGGRVGFSLAAAHPHRIVSLISAAGAPRSKPGAFDRVFFPGCIDVLETGSIAAFMDAWEEHTGRPLDTSTRAAIGANDALALAAYMREADRDAGVPDDVLAAMTVQTLMLVGSRDAERVPAAQHAVATMRSAKIRMLAGANHGETLRHPDALPAVRTFIDDVEGGRTSG
jgi:pimeloyl-ACP methyl ester carboxylesterase